MHTISVNMECVEYSLCTSKEGYNAQQGFNVLHRLPSSYMNNINVSLHGLLL